LRNYKLRPRLNFTMTLYSTAVKCRAIKIGNTYITNLVCWISNPAFLHEVIGYAYRTVSQIWHFLIWSVLLHLNILIGRKSCQNWYPKPGSGEREHPEPLRQESDYGIVKITRQDQKFNESRRWGRLQLTGNCESSWLGNLSLSHIALPRSCLLFCLRRKIGMYVLCKINSALGSDVLDSECVCVRERERREIILIEERHWRRRFIIKIDIHIAFSEGRSTDEVTTS